VIAFHDGAAAPERPTLLVVDDEEHVRFAMQTYFGASDARGALPFVLITGYGSARVLAEATRLGVSALLTKPKPLADIALVVRALLVAPAA
jgi:CheY-like chemotaxis protein